VASSEEEEDTLGVRSWDDLESRAALIFGVLDLTLWVIGAAGVDGAADEATAGMEAVAVVVEAKFGVDL